MEHSKETKTRAAIRKPRQRELSSTERIDRIELLSHTEALLIQAMSHVMHLGFGGELNWPALIARPDGTRVNVLERAVDLAAERLEGLCAQVEAEIIELTALPTRSVQDRYKVVQPRSREHPQPQEKLHPNVKSIDGSAAKPAAPQSQPGPGPVMKCVPKQGALK